MMEITKLKVSSTLKKPAGSHSLGMMPGDGEFVWCKYQQKVLGLSLWEVELTPLLYNYNMKASEF